MVERAANAETMFLRKKKLAEITLNSIGDAVINGVNFDGEVTLSQRGSGIYDGLAQR